MGALLRVNNFITRLRCRKVEPKHILLLVPHCLQWQTCNRNVKADLANCVRCGNCKVADLLALSERYGVRVELVSGGRKAVAAVREDSVKAVVAVACGKELSAGLKAIFPKKTLAVRNRQPEGPCVNTTVDVNTVEDAIVQFIKQPGKTVGEDTGAL